MSIFNKTILSLTAALLMCATVFGQLDLPRKSPKANIAYTIGYTTITINYSSPSVNDRNVWGELVPYDKVWRAGANEATTIEFSTDVKIENKELAAGKYSFFFIPTKGDKWTAIFNKVTDQWGHYSYDESSDALRVEISTKTTKVKEERLNYSVVDQGINKGYIRFGWGKKRAYLRFRMEVMEQALSNIKTAIESTPEDKKWNVYGQAADFLADDEKQLDQALEYAKKSTALFSHSWNWWVQAQIQAKKGDFRGAIASATKAKEVSAKNAEDNYYDDIKTVVEAKVAEWKERA